MKAHPDEPHFAFGTALARIAGKRNEDAKKLLAPLIAKAADLGYPTTKDRLASLKTADPDKEAQ